MTMWKVGVLAFAMLAIALAPLGCGSDEQAAEKAAPAKMPEKNAQAAKPKTREAGEIREAARGEKQQATARKYRREPAVESAELPENFPKDVPVFPESSPTASLVSGDDDMVVSFKTDAKPKEVTRFYRKALGRNGWKEAASAEEGLQSVLSMEKDGRTATILLMVGPGETHITVTIAAE